MTGTPRTGSFEDRFRQHVRDSEAFAGAAAVIVGVSGGLDSMTLLHLLRFCGGAPPGAELQAAHFDHRMRPESGEDASWVAAVCRDWDVKVHLDRAPAPVRSEAEGRELRYRFFEEARLAAGVPAVVATGHTADDQAETVLFRIARGSGPTGLAGVLPTRTPGLVRPLLPFWRSEIRLFAQNRDVPFREDPSNRDLRWTRNRLRRLVLPALEDAVPGAAAALASHAEASLLQARALDELLDQRIATLTAPRPEESPPPAAGLTLDREALAALSDPVLALVLRRAAARTGTQLGRRATRALVRFVRHAQSGRRLALPRGAVAERHLGRIVFRPAPAPPPPSPADLPGLAAAPGSRPPQPAVDAPADPPTASAARPAAPARVLVTPEPGEGAYTCEAMRVEVAWGPVRLRHFPHVASFRKKDVSFPLVVRPWAPGDRVVVSYGKKKVKKLLLEARVSQCDRPGLPVLAVPGGPVVWVPGVTDGARPAWRRREPRPDLPRTESAPEDHPSPCSEQPRTPPAPPSPWFVHVRSSVAPLPGVPS